MQSLICYSWKMLEKILYFLGVKIFRLKILETNWNVFIQFIKFGIVGLSNTIVSYMIYIVLLLLLHKNHILPEYDYLIAQMFGFVISVLWSFYWNRKYVFKVDTTQISWIQALLKTYVSYAFTGLFLNIILSIIWVRILGVSKMIAPIVNLLISVPLNYILNKFWAFR